MPQDTTTLIELQDDLEAVKIKNNDDPALLFGNHMKIQNKYNKNANIANHVTVTAIQAVPKDYKVWLLPQNREGLGMR